MRLSYRHSENDSILLLSRQTFLSQYAKQLPEYDQYGRWRVNDYNIKMIVVTSGIHIMWISRVKVPVMLSPFRNL
jgi:hypothetical protein